MAVETHTIRIQADVSQFEAAIRRLGQRIEQSIARTARDIDA